MWGYGVAQLMIKEVEPLLITGAMSWFPVRSGAVSDLPEEQITIDNPSSLTYE